MKVIVVDDEPQIRRALRTSLEAHGYEVSAVGTGEEGVLAAAEQRARHAHDLPRRRRQVDQAAVAQRQTVGGDEAQAARVNVAGVDRSAGLARATWS